MLKTSLLITLTERVTSPLRRMRSAIRGTARDGERDIGRLGRAFGRLGPAVARGAASIRTNLRAAIGRALTNAREQAQRGGRAIGRAIASGIKATLTLGAIGLAATAGGLLYQLTVGVIRTASEFEQFQVVLENTEGSANAARRAMAWVQRFAQTTPYEVGDVMAAFVRLKAYGIDPMNGSLRSLGNAASGMNKSIMDAVEMLADAQTGEFERLKEFGIRARVVGDRVRLSYRRNGRDMVREARNNGSDIQNAITGIFDEKFEGMMDRQSTTLAGLWSNLKDQWTQFQLTVARAGIFDWVKARIQGLLNKVNELARNGTLQRWAEQISTWLETAGDRIWTFVSSVDWQAAGRDIKTLADSISYLARALRLVGFVGGSISDGVRYQFNPRGRMNEVYRLRDEVRAQRQAEAAAAERRRAGPLRRQPGARMPGLPGGSAARSRTPAAGQRNWLRLGPPVRQGGRPQASRQDIRVKSQVGGRIGLSVSASPQLVATVTRLESVNRDVPIAVSRGLARTG